MSQSSHYLKVTKNGTTYNIALYDSLSDVNNNGLPVKIGGQQLYAALATDGDTPLCVKKYSNGVTYKAKQVSKRTVTYQYKRTRSNDEGNIGKDGDYTVPSWANTVTLPNAGTFNISAYRGRPIFWRNEAGSTSIYYASFNIVNTAVLNHLDKHRLWHKNGHFAWATFSE